MRVVVISGSPHKDGMTAKVLREAAEGAREAGAQVEIISLAERRVRPCLDCEPAPCWERMDCNIKDDDGLALRKELAEADALIFGAPVYFLSVNGLAKDFMDRMRYAKEQEGKPAFPIAVAGGTGKGCILALQDICRWLVMLGFRPYWPLPVTRYDFDIALVEARERGRRLLGLERRPYSGLHDMVAHYESTPMMRWGMAEELAHLARVEIEAIRRRGQAREASQAREELDYGLLLLEMGRRDEALRHLANSQERAMEAFNRLFGED